MRIIYMYRKVVVYKLLFSWGQSMLFCLLSFVESDAMGSKGRGRELKEGERKEERNRNRVRMKENVNMSRKVVFAHIGVITYATTTDAITTTPTC